MSMRRTIPAPQITVLDDRGGHILELGVDPVMVGPDTATYAMYDVRAIRSTVHTNRYLDRQARERKDVA
jgi:hypothetical protein